jgi:hypothetical protein
MAVEKVPPHTPNDGYIWLRFTIHCGDRFLVIHKVTGWQKGRQHFAQALGSEAVSQVLWHLGH